MRKRPMLFLSCIFVLAILFATYHSWYFLFFAGVLFCYGIERLLRQKDYARLLLRGLCIVVVFWIAFFHVRGEINLRVSERADILVDEDCFLQGSICKKEWKNDSVQYTLKNCYVANSNTNSLQWTPCNQVMLYLDTDEYSIGETLFVFGKMNTFSSATNEGQFDLRKYYESLKIDYCMYTPEVLKNDGRKNYFLVWIEGVKNCLHQVYLEYMEEPYGGVLSAMILGQKSGFSPEIRKLYQSSGISHIVAISGMHLTLVGMTLYRFLRKRRAGYAASFVCSMLVLFVYVQLAGGSVSTFRAFGMLALMMFAGVVGRSYDLLNALGLVVMLLLWENPFLLTNTGFQFSVTAMLGIAIVCRNLVVETDSEMKRENSDSVPGKKGCCVEEDVTKKGFLKRKKMFVESRAMQKCILSKGRFQGLCNQILSGVGIWLSTLPLVAYCYYEIPTYSIFLNLLVLPFMKWLFGFGIAGGMAGLLAQSISNVIGQTFALHMVEKVAQILLMPAYGILLLYDKMANLFMLLPKSQLVVGCPGILKTVVYYLILLFLSHIWFCYRKGFKKRLAGILLMLFLFFAKGKHGFEVDVLDVGQGDGTYICTQTGEHIFIDGGSANVKQVGQNRILPFLKYNGVAKIDYWFLSHADKDHTSGCIELLELGYTIDHLVLAKAVRNDASVQELALVAKEAGAEVIWLSAEDELVFEEDSIICLWPGGSDDNSGTNEKGKDSNDQSLVLLYQNHDFKGLFTGDISSGVEEQLVEKHKEADADDLRGNATETANFYKVAHHGSKYSNSEKLLEYFSPHFATISCSARNRYGHPAPEVISRLNEVKAAVYCTKDCGQIRLTLDKSGECVSWTYVEDTKTAI